MRSLDLINLALSALWRRKLRALLTTLGVVFGTFVLVASLSVRDGTKATIARQYNRFGGLRHIDVMPRVALPAEVPQEKLKVPGNVSPERRQRLLAEIRRRWPAEQTAAPAPTLLTPQRLRSLADRPHVVSVTLGLVLDCSASLGGKTGHARALSTGPEAHFRNRLIAGGALPSGDAHSVLVTEYLLYRLGIVDEADVFGVVGSKLRLEYRPQRPRQGLFLVLQPGQGLPSVEEERLARRLQEQLPKALAVLDLAPAERATVRKWLRPSAAAEDKEERVVEEFTVCGVLRTLAPAEATGRYGWEQREADVVLPVRADETIYFRVPRHRQQGVHRATVEVDEVDNVKEVLAQLQSEGFHVRAPIELLEREQYTYLMITSAMALVALVALLVAGLGITNTMLMSVLERVHEIGIMKAVGARDAHIRRVFLMEGALVGAVGGVLGLALAWAASFPGNAWVRATVERRLSIVLEEGSLFAFPPWLTLGAPLFACLVTMLAAYYPARRAARISPVAALRYE